MPIAALCRDIEKIRSGPAKVLRLVLQDASELVGHDKRMKMRVPRHQPLDRQVHEEAHQRMLFSIEGPGIKAASGLEAVGRNPTRRVVQLLIGYVDQHPWCPLPLQREWGASSQKVQAIAR